METTIETSLLALPTDFHPFCIHQEQLSLSSLWCHAAMPHFHVGGCLRILTKINQDFGWWSWSWVRPPRRFFTYFMLHSDLQVRAGSRSEWNEEGSGAVTWTSLWPSKSHVLKSLEVFQSFTDSSLCGLLSNIFPSCPCPRPRPSTFA